MDRYSVVMNHTTIINGVEFEKGLHAITEEEAAYFVTTPHRVTKNGNRLTQIPADMETKKDLMSVFWTPEEEKEDTPEDEVVEEETPETKTETEEADAETEEVEEEVEETETKDTEEAETETEKVDEKATEENVTTEDEAEAESDETDPEILATREEYEKVLWKTVSNRYMNDVKWMKDKIAEAQKAEA